MAQSSATFAIQRINGNTLVADSDSVAVEEPLEIRLGYPGDAGRQAKSVSITMRTPGNDDELALGFLFTEGIISAMGDVQSVAHCGPVVAGKDLHNVIRVELQDSANLDLQRLERHFYTSSSCGVCGKTSIEALRVQSPFTLSLATGTFSMPRDKLVTLPDALARQQRIFGQTGGLHVSGLFDADGVLSIAREDVGRHNALDKLIGRQLLDGQLPLASSGILVSGRTSFELMQKVMMAGCPMLAAVGAPSSLAVEMAQEFGVTLIGFLRDGRFNVYSGEHRLVA